LVVAVKESRMSGLDENGKMGAMENEQNGGDDAMGANLLKVAEVEAPLPCPSAPDACIAVLFDYDGTLGDTETPAMEVAFWEIAPYLPALANASISELKAACPIYVRENAGKAFEHMLHACDEQRQGLGLQMVESTRANRSEPPELLACVDSIREELGLQKIAVMRSDASEPLSLLVQQKEDTVVRLAKAARPTAGTIEALDTLKQDGVPFVIATTSGKPRVPVCVDAAGMRSYFPSDDAHIHSGESDFVPSKFKPEPDVYLKAAQSVDREPGNCVAVEDSASGVGSASNAGIGLIVGYVGASHIGQDAKASHASMLMAGTRAKNGRGADVVISHMHDLPKLVSFFKSQVAAGKKTDGWSSVSIPESAIPNPCGEIYWKQ